MPTTFDKTLGLIAYDNALTERKDDFYLRAQTQPRSISRSDVAEEVRDRLSVKLDKEVIETVIACMEDVVCDAVSSGYLISTPLFMARPTANGVVTKAELGKAANRDKIKVMATLTPGMKLRDAMQECDLRIYTQPAMVGPLVNAVVSGLKTTDANGNTTRAAITAGGVVEIQGTKLKVVGEDASNGVTLTSADDPEMTYFIAPQQLLINEPKRLMFQLPSSIMEGTEWLATVTTQYAGRTSTLISKPRSYMLNEPFYVGLAVDNGTPGGGSSSGGSSGGGNTGGGSGDDDGGGDDSGGGNVLG